MCLVTSKCVPKSNGFVYTLYCIFISSILKLYCLFFSFSSISNFCFSIANFSFCILSLRSNCSTLILSSRSNCSTLILSSCSNFNFFPAESVAGFQSTVTANQFELREQKIEQMDREFLDQPKT